MKKANFIRSVLVSSIVLMPALSSAAEERKNYSTSNLQVGYSTTADNDFITGYGSKDGNRIQFRFEHQSDNSLGENYFFADVLDFDSPAGGAFGDGSGNMEIYGLWNGNLRASKIFNQDLTNLGIIKDFSLEARLEFGSFYSYKSRALGIGVYLDVPGFRGNNDKFQLNWWRRSNCDEFVTNPNGGGNADGNCYDDHNLWGLTLRKYWTMLGTRWNHQTILRYQQSTTDDNQDPDAAARHDRIFLELEIFAHVYKEIQVGFRYEYFVDEGGIDFDPSTFAVNRDTNKIPIFVVKYDFH